MKKIFSISIIFFILNIFASSAYAENACINNILNHLWGSFLDLSKCHLQDQDMTAVTSFIQTCPIQHHVLVEKLSLADNNIGPNGIANLKLQQVYTLILDDNNLGDDGVDRLSKSISDINNLSLKNNHLTDKAASGLEKIPLYNLDLSDNQMTAVGARYLAKNPFLRILAINNNFIGDEGAMALASNPSLEKIMVDNNQLTDAAAIEISKHTKITWVSISNNNITAKGANALASNPELRYLDIGHNQIGDNGIKAFMNNQNLTWLSVRDNQIGPDGAIAIATVTKFFWEKLDISQNPIGLKGVAALAKIQNLAELDISDTNLGDRGVSVFAENHPDFAIINLGKNHITQKGLDNLLKEIPDLTFQGLDLSSNDLGDEGVASLAGHAKHFYKELNLSNNHITANGIKSLLNNQYDFLILSNNDIGDNGAASLGKIHSIYELTLEHCGITDNGALLLTKNERKITFMNIRNNPIRKSGIAALKEWFKGNEKYLEIDE